MLQKFILFVKYIILKNFLFNKYSKKNKLIYYSNKLNIFEYFNKAKFFFNWNLSRKFFFNILKLYLLNFHWINYNIIKFYKWKKNNKLNNLNFYVNKEKNKKDLFINYIYLYNYIYNININKKANYYKKFSFIYLILKKKIKKIKKINFNNIFSLFFFNIFIYFFLIYLCIFWLNNLFNCKIIIYKNFLLLLIKQSKFLFFYNSKIKSNKYSNNSIKRAAINVNYFNNLHVVKYYIAYNKFRLLNF